MLKHEEILNNQAFQNAVYVSTVSNEEKITLYELIRELRRIFHDVGNGPITISHVADPASDDGKRQLILTVSTSDSKIHSFHIHPVTFESSTTSE